MSHTWPWPIMPAILPIISWHIIAVGEDELPCGWRQMHGMRAVALGLGRVETQLFVQIIEPDRLQFLDAAAALYPYIRWWLGLPGPDRGD